MPKDTFSYGTAHIFYDKIKPGRIQKKNINFHIAAVIIINIIVCEMVNLIIVLFLVERSVETNACDSILYI